MLSSRSAHDGPWLNFIATWYSPSGGVGNGLTTASGMRVSENLIAVDPSVIPIGSIVEVKYDDGRIERKWAADTGGAIRGQKIDIFCWSEATAQKNGRQKVQVRVIGQQPIKR